MTDHQALVLQSCNRHMARLLYNLERANCPKVYHAAVKNELAYLRDDMVALAKTHAYTTVDKHRMND
jgi:hypothetical protein